MLAHFLFIIFAAMCFYHLYMVKKIQRILLICLSILVLLPTSIFAYGNPYYGGYSNCTWTAWQLVYSAYGIALPNFGNAGNWANAARSYGYGVGYEPAAGSVAVWSSHVAYVASVDYVSNTTHIQEGGYLGGYNERTVPASSSVNGQAFLGYIYISGGSSYVPEGDSYNVNPWGISRSTPSSSSNTTASRAATKKQEEKTTKVSVDELFKESTAVTNLGDGITISTNDIKTESLENIVYVDALESDIQK